MPEILGRIRCGAKKESPGKGLMLSKEEKLFFQEKGHLILPGFVSLSDCKMLIDRATEIADGQRPAGEASYFSTENREQDKDKEFHLFQQQLYPLM